MEKQTTAKAGQTWRVRGDLKDDRAFLGGKVRRKGEVVPIAPGQVVPLELVELVQPEAEPKTEAQPEIKVEQEAEALTASGLAKLKKEELQALAKDKGLAWDEKMTKDALVQLILAGAEAEPKTEAQA